MSIKGGIMGIENNLPFLSLTISSFNPLSQVRMTKNPEKSKLKEDSNVAKELHELFKRWSLTEITKPKAA